MHTDKEFLMRDKKKRLGKNDKDLIQYDIQKKLDKEGDK
ncbi:hypothetical protein BAC3_00564 [uncultured bacterium]|nr:hypothetical protein BAC3_00564 [uncultured bacterium]